MRKVAFLGKVPTQVDYFEEHITSGYLLGKFTLHPLKISTKWHKFGVSPSLKYSLV